MSRLQTFQEFLATQSGQIPVLGFVLNLLLAALLSFILSRIYLKYGTTLSNRKLFGRNFLLITMTTMLIISIVKSSLALSLGLVGALSIVRFRAAIKEPEELAYLFIAIAIGLGLGADQAKITIIAMIIISLIIVIRQQFSKKVLNSQNLHLTVYSKNPKKLELKEFIDTLKKYCSAIDLRRFDETKELLEVSFLIELINIDKLIEAKTELQKLDESLKITFIDNKGII